MCPHAQGGRSKLGTAEGIGLDGGAEGEAGREVEDFFSEELGGIDLTIGFEGAHDGEGVFGQIAAVGAGWADDEGSGFFGLAGVGESDGGQNAGLEMMRDEVEASDKEGGRFGPALVGGEDATPLEGEEEVTGIGDGKHLKLCFKGCEGGGADTGSTAGIHFIESGDLAVIVILVFERRAAAAFAHDSGLLALGLRGEEH